MSLRLEAHPLPWRIHRTDAFGWSFALLDKGNLLYKGEYFKGVGYAKGYDVVPYGERHQIQQKLIRKHESLAWVITPERERIRVKWPDPPALEEVLHSLAADLEFLSDKDQTQMLERPEAVLRLPELIWLDSRINLRQYA